MSKILLAVCVALLAASTLQAQDSLTLNLPATGMHPDGTVFTTSIIDGGGATYDIEYTLTAVANDEATQDAVINSLAGLSFGVNSLVDGGATGPDRTFDGDGNEGVEISNLSITNFVPGSDGLVASDLAIAFETVTFQDGTNRFDGIYLSYINQPSNDTTLFDPLEDFQINRPGLIPDPINAPGVFADLPPTVDLTTLDLYDPTATTMYLNTDNTGSSNRWEISGMTVAVTGGTTPTVVPPVTNILLGDVDLSGAVDFLDINPFIEVLASGGFQAEADCDESGIVDFLDIAPFIAILAGG